MDQRLAGPTQTAATVSSIGSFWRGLAYPSTRLGWWSVALGALFFVFLKLVFVWGDQPGHDRSTFFSDPVAAFTLLGTAVSGIAAAAVAVVAMVKREHSIFVLLVFLLGLFVLYFSLGELAGH
jgi:hypothetical protein